MTPTDKYRAAQGETEALPDALRDMLLSPAKTAPLPGLPPQPVHRTGREAPSISRSHLSNKQKQVLCQLASTAYAFQAKHGLIDQGVKLDAWRRAEQLAAVGIASLRDCRQAHYLPLKGHFEALAGKTDVPTFQAAVAPADHADRACAAQALREELARFANLTDHLGRRAGEFAAEDYLMAIARARANSPLAKLQDICDTWPPTKIWTLVYTMRNRIAAKKGVGSTDKRNKSQRRRPR